MAVEVTVALWMCYSEGRPAGSHQWHCCYFDTCIYSFQRIRIPSDIIAGMALLAKEQRESEVHSYYNNYIPIQIVPKKNILNMRCKNVHHKLSPCVQMHFGAKYDTTISLCLPGISTWSVVI